MCDFYNMYVKACNDINKSPSAVALEIGISKTAVNGWKTGRTKPTDATRQKVYNYFGVTALEWEAEQKENPTAQMGSEALKDIGYYQLNEENKKLIDQMIVQLIKSQSVT